MLVFQSLKVIWASPWSLLGLAAGVLTLLSGGRAQFPGRAVEFHGGFANWLLEMLPNGESVLAMTLGHTILGKSPAALEIARAHEWVHVQQYERWGPLFGPAYLGCSLFLWVVGRDAYRENPFEREAYEQDNSM